MKSTAARACRSQIAATNSPYLISGDKWMECTMFSALFYTPLFHLWPIIHIGIVLLPNFCLVFCNQTRTLFHYRQPCIEVLRNALTVWEWLGNKPYFFYISITCPLYPKTQWPSNNNKLQTHILPMDIQFKCGIKSFLHQLELWFLHKQAKRWETKEPAGMYQTLQGSCVVCDCVCVTGLLGLQHGQHVCCVYTIILSSSEFTL